MVKDALRAHLDDEGGRATGRPTSRGSQEDGAMSPAVDVIVGAFGLSPFERSVLRKTLEIPRGQVRPYGWIAREIGHPAAVRAVGTALANNPIPYFIPCHRVIRSDGVIGNYGGGGPEAKKNILTLEGVQLKRLQDLARAGLRYEGVRSTRVFCFPTCYHGRAARQENFVFFHDEGEARAAGYRPCKHCRPAEVA